MKPVDRPAPLTPWARWGSAAVLPAAALALVVPLSAGQPIKPATDPTGKAARTAPTTRAVVVHFTDDSTLKLTLQDDKLELHTPYGKLLIPVADVHQIELGRRLSEDDARRVEAAIANLGSPQFKVREAAGVDLLALREKAYPALLRAAKQKDAEVVRRAEDLLAKIKAVVPGEQLERPDFDIVHTEHSKIAGRLATAALKVTTGQFGEQQLKLADVRSLKAVGVVDTDTTAALADPGTLMSYQGEIGKTLKFKVTGNTNGSVWGTDVYTSDSALAAAAVHAGVLKNGQTGTVRVTIVAPPPTFAGTTRNGVTSAGYGPFQGAFKIDR